MEKALELSGRYNHLGNYLERTIAKLKALKKEVDERSRAQDKAAKEPFPTELRTGHQVITEARARGAILRPLSDTIVLMPPLSITEGELGELLDITYGAVDEVCGGTGSAEPGTAPPKSVGSPQ